MNSHETMLEQIRSLINEQIGQTRVRNLSWIVVGKWEHAE